MVCYHPLKGWKGVANEDGKRVLCFTRPKGLAGVGLSPIEVPCGKCIGCRLEHARQWAVRLIHEKQFHDETCFITLTYDDEHLPKDGSLNVRDIQLFFKKLRKAHSDRKIRFFQCGEYGEGTGRPHHHAIIFGYDFPDAKPHIFRDQPFKRSDELTNLWGNGHTSVGDVTVSSVSYVAGYVIKKAKESQDIDYGNKKPPFVTMSRNKGIGREFFDRYSSDIYPSDSVIINGKEVKPPRYYDKILAIDNPVLYDKIHSKRLDAIDVHDPDVSFDRLDTREYVAKRKQEIFSKRSL